MRVIPILTGIAILIIGTNAQNCVLNKYYCSFDLTALGTVLIVNVKKLFDNFQLIMIHII